MDKYYNNMEISGGSDGDNENYFDLIEQQAKNLYLNIKYGKDSRN